MGADFLALFGYAQFYIMLVAAYLLGSIPTSYLAGKLFFHKDIRESGSGNAGATNALRSFGVKTGVLVLSVDVFKGVAAILLANWLSRSFGIPGQANLGVALSGLAVTLGHVFSLFLGFRGGKGVATAAGVFLILLPIPLLFCIVFFAFVVNTTRLVSLGSLLTAFALLMIELISQAIMSFPNLPRLLLLIAVAMLITARHTANIKHLLNGSESKLGPLKEKDS